MDRLLRRPEPAAIDITWVSCRGVRSSLPFHTPCLYASIYLMTSSSAAKSVHGRRPHRVKTPTDRAGGENPEWDAPLRLYVPDAASPAPEQGAGNKKDRDADGGGALLVRFELKSEVAVLGDVLAASAVVPVSDLVADGRTRRVSYQLAASDGRQPNGVISFSYAFHDRSNNDADEDRSSDGEPVTLCCLPAACTVALPPPQQQPTAVSGMYPVIDWALTEQVAVYPPVTFDTVAVTGSRYHPPPPPVYPPLPDSSACGLYPRVGEPASGMYPTVDLVPVSCYPPTAPCYGAGCGYAAAPERDGRCLYS